MGSGEIRMGQVTAITPDVEVRFWGSTVSVVVAWKDSGLTLATSDRVVLVRAGSDSWVIISKVAAS